MNIRAFSYLSDGPNERIEAMIQSGIVPRIVSLLVHSSSSMQTPALRTVGNIITGTDTQTQYILDFNILPHLIAMFDSPKMNIRKEACWTISNITAGTRDQIQMVIDREAIPKLIRILLHSEEYEVQKEAAWAIANATSGGSTDQINYLVEQGSIAALSNILSAKEVKILTMILEGLENILKSGMQNSESRSFENIKFLFSDCGSLEKLKALQDHPTSSIYQRTLHILRTYFDVEEVKNEDEERGVSDPEKAVGQNLEIG